jgi:hypothetical protein
MLIQHLLGNRRQAPLQFTRPDGAFLELVKNCDSPLPLKKFDGGSNYRLIGTEDWPIIDLCCGRWRGWRDRQSDAPDTGFGDAPVVSPSEISP